MDGTDLGTGGVAGQRTDELASPTDGGGEPSFSQAVRDAQQDLPKGDPGALIAQSTDPQGKLDAGALATQLVDAAHQDPGQANAAYAGLRAALPPAQARQLDDAIAARASADAASGAAMGGLRGGRSALVHNPILTKSWESTASAWTGKGGFTPRLTDLLQRSGIEIANPRTPNPPPAGSLGRDSGVPSAQANNTNGRLAEDAIRDRYRAEGLSAETQQPSLGGSRRVDVRVEVPHPTDPRLNQRIDVESKVGRTGLKDSQLLGEVASDARELAGNRGARALGGVAEGAGKVLVPLGVATDAWQIHQSLQEDGGHVGTHTERTASGIAGGWAGAAAGAEGGAELGATIGTFIEPGGGTAVGAVVGGVIGGIGGALAGDSLGRRAFDTIRSWF